MEVDMGDILERQERFERILTALGHNYIEDAPELEGSSATDRVRHLSWPDTPVKPLCRSRRKKSDPDAGFLMLRELFADINCPKCREALMMDDKRAITKRTLMVELVNSMISIEQMFVEAIYWKLCRSEEKPINPDPDGLLAEGWQANANQLIKMIEMARPLMEYHGDKYGWAETLTEAS
jgi:hypothetical protein